MFAMFSKGDLLLSLSPDRVQELIDEGTGLPYDPGTGKVMAGRVLVPVAQKERWPELCEESLSYFRSK